MFVHRGAKSWKAFASEQATGKDAAPRLPQVVRQGGFFYAQLNR